MKKKFLIAVLFVVIVVLFVFFIFLEIRKNKNQSFITIGNHKFFVEIADNSQTRIKGLSNRDVLCQTCGMLFVFEKPGVYSFWMKDMKFALDFVWIAEDKVVDIDKNILPDYPGILQPKEPVDKVLEINAGLIDKYGIKIEDKVKFP